MDTVSGWVFVVDDDAFVRNAMARLLAAHGYEVGTYGSAGEFLDAPQADHPAVCLVLDVRLPDLNGLDLQLELSSRDRIMPIVFITGYGDIPMSVRAMKRGAVDFLSKPVHDEDLLNAVAEALRKDRAERYASEKICGTRLRLKHLTGREYEVLQFVIAGLLNKQIAFALGISEKTVKVHRARIMAKTGAISLPDLVRLCEQANIAPDPAAFQYR